MSSKDLIASEYALGTLSTSQRQDVSEKMEHDGELRQLVEEWELRLAPVANVSESVKPPKRVWQEIKKRMGTNNTSLPQGIEAVYHNEGEWRAVNDKVELKSLFVDADQASESYLLRFQPDGVIEQHVHGQWNDECIVLEGAITVGAVEFGPGDFHVATCGAEHPRLSSKKGGVLFVRSRQITGLPA